MRQRSVCDRPGTTSEPLPPAPSPARGGGAEGALAPPPLRGEGAGGRGGGLHVQEEGYRRGRQTMDRLLFTCLSPLLILAILGSITAQKPADRPARAKNWPRFRGPDGSGVSAATNVPLEWSATKNVVWKAELPGRGASSPIL